MTHSRSASTLIAWMLLITQLHAAWGQSPEAPSGAMKLVHAMELPQTVKSTFEGAVRRDIAVEFFSSPEGKAYLRYSYAVEAASRGLPGVEAPGELSDEAYERLQKFLKTSAGQKLVLEHVWRTPELMGALTKHVSALIRRCHQ
jgi:hypothetical protein